MIVVAIIGILTAVAVPAYQDYAVRTKMSEAILALAGCRTTITEVFLSGATAPAANEWGCEGNSTKFVASIATDGRSEERRVGKECRSRWTQEDENQRNEREKG